MEVTAGLFRRQKLDQVKQLEGSCSDFVDACMSLIRNPWPLITLLPHLVDTKLEAKFFQALGVIAIAA